MVTPGSVQDIFNRLKSNLPPWFGNNSTPILDAILQGYATATGFNYQQYIYDKFQTRLQTATDNNLDLYAQDCLGDQLPRRLGESDTTYRLRIGSYLLLQRNTKKGIHDALKFLTGIEPILFEPFDGNFCGYFGQVQTLAFNAIGCYGGGGTNGTYQGSIDVFVPESQGSNVFSGFGSNPSGLNSPTSLLWYGTDSTDFITDLDVLILIAAFKVYGTVVHVRIHHGNYISFYDA